MRTLKGFLYLILGGTLCGWMFNRIAAWFIDNPLTVGSNHTVAEWAVILQDPFYLDSRTMPFFFLAFGALALVTMTKYDWTGEREEQKKLRGEEYGNQRWARDDEMQQFAHTSTVKRVPIRIPQRTADAMRFEYGRVEQGFTTRDGGWDREGIKDVHDDIASAEDTAAENGSDTDDSGTGTGTAYAPAIVCMKATDGYTAGTSLDNYARVDLTRNGGGDGLEDHDEDQVTQTAKAVTVPPTNLDQTGRNVIIGLAATLAAAAAAAAALIYRRRHAYPDPVPAGGEDDGYEEDAHEREYRDDRYPDGYDRDPYGYDDGYRDSYRDRY